MDTVFKIKNKEAVNRYEDTTYTGCQRAKPHAHKELPRRAAI